MPARSGASSSSMHTTTSLSSSWLEGSPSRQSPSRLSLRPRRETMERESPSRQAQHAEFNYMLNRSERSFCERLDYDAAELAKSHDEQLNKASFEHERVQRCAQLEIDRLMLQLEIEKKEREEQQRLENERLSREKQQRALEAKRQEEEAARKAAEDQRQLQEADARLKAQKEQAETARRQLAEREEATRKGREAAVATEQARFQQAQQAQLFTQTPRTTPATAPTPLAAKPPPTTQSAANTDLEVLHSKYLELHKRMKEFRSSFAKQHAAKGSPLKETVGGLRRDMRLRMGQVTVDRKSSIAAIKRMREEVFDKALATPGPMIDIRQFIISHPISAPSNDAGAQYPALLLYAFCCFTKSLLKQFETEAAKEDGRIIQEVGLIAASLLADQKYMWNGIPMTDVVMAKYHNACPIIFGVRDTMDTPQGQARLGWKKIHGEAPQVNTYNQYMVGLGCGFAALSLRQFTGKIPAVPMAAYWRAVSSICNTPAENLYGGHFMILKGLLRDYAKRFIGFYGAQARGVLRKATVDLPARAPQRATDTASLVSVLKDVWLKNGRLSLD